MLSWHAEQTQAQNTVNKVACKSNAALRKHEQKLACNNFGTKQGEMGSVQTATHRGVGTAWMWSSTVVVIVVVIINVVVGLGGSTLTTASALSASGWSAGDR